ncbi:NmrA family NAD(P)-binding protein [Nocardia sp. NPDC057668]|uniref:NmrA family NAD(P)-binding protein n=1 Tax=Nocardia sp. NPDC057668 TaxID=3346202 RepID=UPI003672FFD2
MSVQHDPILITGATGQQGGATARHLLHIGIPVRALVRDPDAPAARALATAGAELAVGDFDDPATLAPALAGVRAALLVPPATFTAGGWDTDLEAGRGEAFVAAAQSAGLDHLVFTGVAGLKEEGPWGAHGKRRIEDALRASGLRWTILRPVRFMENYLLRNSPVDGLTDDGVHRHLFVADAPLQTIALADVGAVAVLALTDPDRFHGRVLELAGDDLTPDAAAARITESTGHTVRYEEVTEAEARAIGPEVTNVWLTAHEGKGWHADIAAVREIHPGLRTFDDWLTETGAALVKARLAG